MSHAQLPSYNRNNIIFRLTKRGHRVSSHSLSSPIHFCTYFWSELLLPFCWVFIWAVLDKPSNIQPTPLTQPVMWSTGRTRARPEKAFHLLLCSGYDSMRKSYPGNQMFDQIMSQLRKRSRTGPSKSAAQLVCRQICALHILLVSASVAARITSKGSVINKLSRFAVSEQQNFSKTLKMDLGALFRVLSFCPPIATCCQETALLCTKARHWQPLYFPSLSPSSHVLLSPSSLTGAWQCPVSQFWQLPLLILEFSKAFCSFYNDQPSKTPNLHNSRLARHRLEKGCKCLKG